MCTSRKNGGGPVCERRGNVQVFRLQRDSAGLGCGTRVRESYVMSAPTLSPIPTAKMSMIQLYSLYSIYSLLEYSGVRVLTFDVLEEEAVVKGFVPVVKPLG